MSAAPKDAFLLRDTFEKAVSDPGFGARFYARLFEAHPEIAPMFSRNSPGAQQKMFAQKLAAIVDAVEDPEALRAALSGVARSHVQYGVKREMYDWVGTALFATLEEALPGEWTDDTDRAWRKAYATVSEMILSFAKG
jgi:nitric oxide dioxygenase